MTARITVSDAADIAAIAQAAGAGAPGSYWLSGGVLTVLGVTQDELATAATPDRLAPAPPAPASVTNFQARALMAATILPDGRSLEAAVNAMLADALGATADLPASDPARITARQNWLAWEQSNEFIRTGPLVTAIGAALGYDASALDEMFRQAALIEA